MKNKVNLYRQMKHHVWRLNWNWFVSCNPGLEKIVQKELISLNIKTTSSDLHKGGVSFKGKFKLGYLTNLWLRSAGRIFLCLVNFRVRTWEDLLNQLKKINWELFINTEKILKIDVILKNSNLKHKGRIAEETLSAIRNKLKKVNKKISTSNNIHEKIQRIVIRAVDRRCQINLDTTGDHLHKRGYRKYTSKAPLREDIAASLLILANYKRQELLLDPMCGSGTLPIEGALLINNNPPLCERSIAIECWPCHQKKTWQYILSQSKNNLFFDKYTNIMAFDKSSYALNIAINNSRLAKINRMIYFKKENFFKYDPPKGKKGLLIINPPYGKRMGTLVQAEKGIKKINSHLIDTYKGWRVAIIIPFPHWLKHLTFKKNKLIKTSFNGIDITLMTGVIE